jgi:3-phosphoshikimate 1-carboxyvinyltransferase
MQKMELSMTRLKVFPAKKITGDFTIPASKPETQRAIVIATLAAGTSIIKNDLRCSETATMKNACKSLGAAIIEHPYHLEITGVGGKMQAPAKVIDCKGSGLVFRVFTALACFIPSPVIISGDSILCGRVMKPLFDALRKLGAHIENICGSDTAPIINRGASLTGGICHLPGNISSQFITAILFAAPFAQAPTKIVVDGEMYSLSYIRQTIHFMQAAGIEVEFDEIHSTFTVHPGVYHSININIKEDYTSASYILASAALFKGTTRFKKAYGESMQGESEILKILEIMDITHYYSVATNELVIKNPHAKLTGHYEFDAKNYPNIVPTLAALGAFVIGSFKVTGAALTRFHKAPRVEAMTTELKKLGVDISIVYKNDFADGFIIYGKETYPGNITFSNWKDHRIFMSLFIASLKCAEPCYFTEYLDVDCSFPTFFEDFKKVGVKMEIVEETHLHSIKKQALKCS